MTQNKIIEMAKQVGMIYREISDEFANGNTDGVDLETIFCGESMFSKVANASKVAFIQLSRHLKANNYKLLDCQIYNPHLESLGCREIARDQFIEILKN